MGSGAAAFTAKGLRIQSVFAFALLKLRRTPRFAPQAPLGSATRSPKGEAWWARQDSNLQPDRYERPALTIELQAPPECRIKRPATVPTPLTMLPVIRQCRVPVWELLRGRRRWGRSNRREALMFRWAVICLVISLIAGGLGLTGVSVFAKRLSLIFFALFFLGFLALIGFAYLVSSAVVHSQVVPALVAISV